MYEDARYGEEEPPEERVRMARSAIERLREIERESRAPSSREAGEHPG